MYQFYFNSVCPAFALMDAPGKKKFLDTEGLCQVCSGAKNKPNHKNPDKKGCPLADKLYCRTCVAEGNSARSRTHHTEVHINKKQAAKQGHLKKSKKDKDDKDPRDGQK